MNKEVNLGLIFMAAITAIVGVILLTNIADTITPMTTPFTITNETVNLAPARLAAGAGINTTYDFTVTHNDFVTDSGNVKYINGTLMIDGTDYAYNYTSKYLRFKNSSGMYANAENKTNANYQYYDTNYVDDSGSRAVIPLIILLFAIAILVAMIVYFKQQSEDTF